MTHPTFTRRQFAQFIVLGSLGLTFASCDRAASSRPLTLNWWLELYADGRIRLLTSKVELGQGAHTGLRTLLAEELDVDPSSVELVQVPSDPRYGEIITGGSFTLAGWQSACVEPAPLRATCWYRRQPHIGMSLPQKSPPTMANCAI